jgi:hypothetical protein
MSTSRLTTAIGSGQYLWWGVALKRNVFLGKKVADPSIKKSKNFFTQPQISLKN